MRAESGGQLDVAERSERVEAVREVAGDAGRMGEQRDALALERDAQGGVFEKAFDAQFHSALTPSKNRVRTWSA